MDKEEYEDAVEEGKTAVELWHGEGDAGKEISTDGENDTSRDRSPLCLVISAPIGAFAS
jgi:hypothetical protein